MSNSKQITGGKAGWLTVNELRPLQAGGRELSADVEPQVHRAVHNAARDQTQVEAEVGCATQRLAATIVSQRNTMKTQPAALTPCASS